MKRILLLTVAVLCLAGLAFAQFSDVGSIDIFSDGAFTSCNITDAPAALVPVYIVHTHANEGAAASQWKLDMGNVVMTFVGSFSPYPTVIGAPLAGVSVAYGSCVSDPDNLIMTVNFFGTGTSPTCALMSIVPDPVALSGMVEIVDCTPEPNGPFKVTLEKGGQARVNPDLTCDCTVPVRETTWGGIKALYGE
jgi:hypothetical protein